MPRVNPQPDCVTSEPARAGAVSGGAICGVSSAAAVYLVWVAATYTLEGSRHTLLRPEAEADRLAYAFLANVLLGTLLPLWVLRTLVRPGRTVASPLPPPPPRPLREVIAGRPSPISISVIGAAALGLIMLLPLWPLAGHPLVNGNVVAQVVPVSVAEVLVCWVLVGAAIEAAVGRGSGRRLVCAPIKWLSATALFGLYHFAHGPPYDTWRMALLLSGVGLLTGAFFLISGEWYGTIVLHGSLATIGVMRSLAEAKVLSSFQVPRPDLYLLAAAAVALLVILDGLLLHRGGRGPITDRSLAGPGPNRRGGRLTILKGGLS